MISGEWNDEGGLDAGKVYLIFGRPTHQWAKETQLPQAANASFIGNSTVQFLGFDAAGIGDVNNDSYSDLAIGALKNETSTYRQVFIFLGRPTSHWQMNQPVSQANASLGFERWVGSPSNDWISGAADVNNDGYDDFIIGASQDDTGETNAGSTYLYFGQSTDQVSGEPFSQANVSFIGDIPDLRAGLAVAGAGDVNNDGYKDILIGGVNVLRGRAMGDGDNDGRAYLCYGRPTSQWQSSLILSTADHSFAGENPGDSFGVHVAGVGDVNNDGFSDIIMSAVHYQVIGDGPTAGRTYLLLGNSTLVPPTPEPTTTTTTTTKDTNGARAGFLVIIPVLTALALIRKKQRKNHSLLRRQT